MKNCEFLNNITFNHFMLSNSASKSIVLEVKDNTLEEREDRDEKYVLKIWPNLNNFKFLKNANFDNVNGLNYEKYVYENIIKDINDNNYSKNFPEYIYSSNNCSLEDIFKFMFKNKKQKEKKLIKKIFLINFIIKFCNLENKRFKSNFEKLIKKDFSSEKLYKEINNYVDNFLKDINENCTFYNELYNYIYNDDTHKNIIFSYICIRKYKSISFNNIFKNFKITSKNYLLFLQIIFQIAYAINILNYYKLNQNDLHLGNILIEKIEKNKKKPIIYYYKNKSSSKKNNFIILDPDYKPIIFDFDRSYIKDKNNIFLENDRRIYQGQKNYYNKKKDIVKLFCYFYDDLDKKIKNNILDIFIEEKNIPIVENIFNNICSCFYNIKDNISENKKLEIINKYNLKNKYDSLLNSPSFLKLFNTPHEIINKIANILKEKSDYSSDKDIKIKNLQKYYEI